MRYQSTNYSCGPVAIANALRVFGKKIPERKIVKLSGATKDGADEEQLITGIEALGYQATVISGDKPPALLDPTLAAGQPIVMSVMNGKHWVTVVGKVGDRYVLVDSTRTKENMKENGVHLISRRELLRRWRCPSEPTKYYGIAIARK